MEAIVTVLGIAVHRRATTRAKGANGVQKTAFQKGNFDRNGGKGMTRARIKARLVSKANVGSVVRSDNDKTNAEF